MFKKKNSGSASSGRGGYGSFGKSQGDAPRKKRVSGGFRSGSSKSGSGFGERKESGFSPAGKRKSFGQKKAYKSSGERGFAVGGRPSRFSDGGSAPSRRPARFQDRDSAPTGRPFRFSGSRSTGSDRPARFERKESSSSRSEGGSSRFSAGGFAPSRRPARFQDRDSASTGRPSRFSPSSSARSDRPARFERKDSSSSRSEGGSSRFSDRGPRNTERRSAPSGRSRFGSRPMQKSQRIKGSTIRIDQLVNKVSEEKSNKESQHEIKHTFLDFSFDERLQKNIERKGYVTPTPIQDQSIPVGLSGRDVIGIANTGTGKTAAFLFPLINKMLADRTQKALILAPTRELAQQIMEELQKFTLGLNLFGVLCIGGASISVQARMIRSPFSFLIGTPGRIIDLVDRRMLYLDKFQNVVLDEADRMVDMGFINDMRTILGMVSKQRQSFFFTATMEPKVEQLIQEFLTNPVKISVKTRDTAENIEQDIVRVPNEKNAKIEVLVEMLRSPDFGKTIVFGRTKFGVDRICKALLAHGIKVDSIHGDKSQNYRMKALNRFKNDEVQVLVATDVAARGLDIREVKHVINFDLPASYEDYVHRIGRTGRAEQKGKAITFVSE